MGSLFEKIYQIVGLKKWLSLSVLLGLLAICGYFAFQIKLEEDITKIIPKGEKTDITAKVIQQLKFSDKIAVMIQAKSEQQKESLAEFAQAFLDTLSFHEHYFTQVQGQVDVNQMEFVFDFVHTNLPLFFDSVDYQLLSSRLTIDSLNKRMEQNFSVLISPAGMVAKNFVVKDPLGLSFVGLNKLRSMGISDDFEIENGFITAENGKTILLFITPFHAGTDTKNNETFVEILYGIQENLNAKYKEVASLSYFGSPFIALANAQQIKQDIQRTVAISLSILMLILVLFYRNIFVPLILFVPVIIGALVSAACLFFLKDSISAISLSIGAVLLGITLDYPIHIITHYRAGVDTKILYQHITKPILSSSLTTSIAFLCLLFVNSEVLQDLGLFAGISVLVSSIAALLITPHLYKTKSVSRTTILDSISEIQPDKSNFLFGLSVIFLMLGLFFYHRVSFNNNLADLNFVPENMKQSQTQLENLGSVGAKSIYVVAYGEDLNSVLDQNQRVESKLAHFKNEGLVSDYTSMGRFVVSEQQQQEKIDKWIKFWDTQDLPKLAEFIQEKSIALGYKKDLYADLENQITDVKTIGLQDLLHFEALPIGDFLTEKDGFYTLSTLVKIDEAKRNELYEKLDDEALVLVDRKHLNEQFLGQLKEDFLKLMNLSFFAIFVIMLVFFRRIEIALLAMVPIVCTGIITAGAMSILGIELNIFSTIVTTLILGLGIDFSIFITSGLQHRFSTGRDEMSVYRTSILLAALTTLLALGTLIFAKHPALTSISWASIIGVFSAMFMSFVFYPRLFYWFIERPQHKGLAPTSLRELANAIISFCFYGFGGIFYSIFGVFYMKFFPLPMERKKRWYRAVIARFLKSIMYSNPWINKKVINLHNEKFETPAIIIANHSSFLDTLSMGFLRTPIIFVVNDWVYKSPIFGKAVQLAGYVPASEGIENGESKLIEYLHEGYSLVIFPEGTRSFNKDIGRFHKGAFYLAKHYNIDIIPVFLHGNGDLNPKGTFIIRDGDYNVVVGERIKANDFIHKDVKTITKEISTKYKSDFRKIRHQLENADYYKKRIRKSFQYKTIFIENEADREFEKHKNWLHKFNEILPHEARIQRIGDDLGVIDLVICLQEPRRKVNTWIKSEEKKSVAQLNHLLKRYKIEYTKNLLSEIDVLILNTKFAPNDLESITWSLIQFVVIEKFIDMQLDTCFELLDEQDGVRIFKNKDYELAMQNKRSSLE